MPFPVPTARPATRPGQTAGAVVEQKQEVLLMQWNLRTASFTMLPDSLPRCPYSIHTRSHSLWPEHVLGLYPFLELLLVEVAQRDGLRLQRGPVLVRRLGDLGRGVIADVRVQRRHQHQRFVQQSVDPITVRLDTVLQNASWLMNGVRLRSKPFILQGHRVAYSNEA